jgi:AAA family ATP:ADP antiporter
MVESMRKLFNTLFDIREGEGLRAALMFLYIFLIIASLLIVKPVRNSLFLTAFGADQLPFAFILVALFSGIFIYFYTWLSKKIYLPKVMLNSILISILVFGIFWALLFFGYHHNWFLYVFYVWAAIFGVVLTMQFWLLANYVFNAREARRSFGFVGAGAISGGIFGGYLTNYLAPIIGTGNMLLICMGFLAICIFLFRIIWRKSARQNYQEKLQQQRRVRHAETSESPLKLIISSKHLSYLAGIIGVGVIVANLVDYQYSAIASGSIQNADELTAFFGFWLSNLSIISLLIQLLLTRRILQTFGVGKSLYFLPVGILIGAVATLINPALWSAIIIKVGDGSLKQSINKAGFELLYLPVPARIKNQAKAFIDVFIDSLATGIGGLLLVVFIIGFGLSAGHVSLMIIAFITIWVILLAKVHKEYINSFRLAIEKRTINIDEESINLEDASVFDNLIRLLSGSNQRQTLYALELLGAAKKEEFLPHFEKLLDHKSTEVRLQTLKHLQGIQTNALVNKIDTLIRDESPEIRVEAMRFLISHSENKIATINDFLSNDDYRVQNSALISVAEELQQDENLKTQINLKRLLEERFEVIDSSSSNGRSELMKITAARIIGISKDPELYPYLMDLLMGSSPKVLEAAIVSAGKIRSKNFIPPLLAHLQTKPVRRYSREALSQYGEEAVEELAAGMKNLESATNLRLAIPKVLALIGFQKSVDVLFDNLGQDDLELRYEVLKALNKLKVNFPELNFDQNKIEKEIIKETRNYYTILLIFVEQQRAKIIGETNLTEDKDGNKVKEARSLLIKALEEKLDGNLERIFRLLGLRYVQSDMFNTYRSIKSKKPDLQANAVEFLDNLLDFNMKRLIIPIAESNSYSYLTGKGRELFGLEISSDSDCLTILLNSDDAWLRGCALYMLAELNNTQCIQQIEKLAGSRSQIVHEMAEYALHSFTMTN